VKKWLSRVGKLAVVLALLTLFSTIAFAKREMVVQSVRLDDGVEVEWEELADFEGMEVWCAAYDKHGRVIAIGQADMNGEACRLKCNPKQVEYVKLFLLNEEVKPAEDVKIPGQSYDPAKPAQEQEHLCVWELVEQLSPNGYFELGEGKYRCPVCEEEITRPIPTQATPEERALKQRAEDAGLLKYIEIADLGEMTRLDAAKLVAAYAGLDVDNAAECSYTGCEGLTAEEKRIITAAVEGDILRVNSDGSFNPNGPVTRSEFILFLMNCVGNPECDWDEECTNVPEWNKYDANTLYNLGILGDDPDIRGSDRATKADALEWLLNARAWKDKIMADITPTNLRFDVGGKWIYWDTEKTNLTNLRYMISFMDDATGAWTPNRGVRVREDGPQGLCTRWREATNYSAVRVVPRIGNENLWDCSVTDWDMTMDIVRHEYNDAVAELVTNADGSQELHFANLPAGEQVRVMVRDDDGDYNDGYSQVVEADGTLICELYVDWDGPIYYAVENFGGYSLDGKNLTYTVTCYGEGVVDQDISDPAYAVTDVWFEMLWGEVPVMRYELPDDISDDARVDLCIPGANGNWDKVMGSNQGYLWLPWLKPGVYDSFKLVTDVNGETKAWVIVDDMDLTLNYGGVSSAQVTFTKTANGYHWEATGGQPDTCFSMEIVEENVGSFRPTGCFDATGVGEGNEGGSHAISHIENGTFVLMEYRDLNVNDKGLTVTIWKTEEKPCNPIRDVQYDYQLTAGEMTVVSGKTFDRMVTVTVDPASTRDAAVDMRSNIAFENCVFNGGLTVRGDFHAMVSLGADCTFGDSSVIIREEVTPGIAQETTMNDNIVKIFAGCPGVVVESEVVVGILSTGHDIVLNGETYRKAELRPDEDYLVLYNIYRGGTMSVVDLGINDEDEGDLIYDYYLDADEMTVVTDKTFNRMVTVHVDPASTRDAAVDMRSNIAFENCVFNGGLTVRGDFHAMIHLGAGCTFGEGSFIICNEVTPGIAQETTLDDNIVKVFADCPGVVVETEAAMGIITANQDVVLNGTTYSKEEIIPDTDYMGVYNIYQNGAWENVVLGINEDDSLVYPEPKAPVLAVVLDSGVIQSENAAGEFTYTYEVSVDGVYSELTFREEQTFTKGQVITCTFDGDWAQLDESVSYVSGEITAAAGDLITIGQTQYTLEDERDVYTVVMEYASEADYHAGVVDLVTVSAGAALESGSEVVCTAEDGVIQTLFLFEYSY